MYMWDDCGFYPSEGIEELKLRCLIKRGNDGKLKMHDQLRDLGRSIVAQGQPPERRSRLWVYEEAFKVLMEKKGTQRVEGISLDESEPLQEYTSEQFKNFQSLRFLQLGWAALSGDFNQLFSQLRWLRWSGIDAESFSATNLHLPNLLVLQLLWSNVTEHWGGWSSFMVAKRLKVLNLEYCGHLRCTPDLSAFTELEILILSSCPKLEQIHPSIGKVKSLVWLDLSDCARLKELPEEVSGLQELRKLLLDNSGITKIPTSIGSLSKLKKLSARHCSSLREVPGSIWNLHNLRHLHFDYSAIEEFGSLKKSRLSAIPKSKYSDELEQIHPSIGKFTSLISLDLRYCKSLKELPEEVGELGELKELLLDDSGITKIPTSIGSLKNLEKLSAHGCSSLREIPSTIGNLQSLQHLDLGRSVIERLPTSIGRLKKLRMLRLRLCNRLTGEIPSEIGDLSSLKILDFRRTSITYLPKSIQNLSSLQHLNLSACNDLQSLPELPSNLTYLTASGRSPKLPQLSCLIHLEQLHLHECFEVKDLPVLPSKLLKLSLVTCPKLSKCQLDGQLDGLKNLEELSIERCRSIERLDLSQLDRLKRLRVKSCHFLVEIQGHDNLELLEEISVMGCKSIQRLILPKLQRLKHLRAIDCKNLVEIRGLGMAQLLETLDIQNCGSIKRLPDLSCFATLEVLDISGCKSLEELPNLSKFENLRIIR
ncbi:disease resistance protein RPV1-like [Rhodamnia argentea]|uniref:Disease resistance protein RPV1-like n=1 Tax=Rhodamnia argentea TaxID=178133 RepID=A0A8B8QEI2_9MYRT|nr:disease resistance protein RPV1-like [Rhodamnia argentea]